MDQSSSFSRTFESLNLFNNLKAKVDAIRSKKGGYTKNEGITLDVIIAGSMGPETLADMTVRGFRAAWGVQFDGATLNKRRERALKFDEGFLGALIDDTKWEGSGKYWDDEAISLFRTFYQLPSPAVYLDTSGRKVNFKNFMGESEYDFLYGLNPKSTV